MTRRHGWAPRGERLVAKVPHGHWKTATFKTLLRKADARTYDAVSAAAAIVLAQYSPNECAAYLGNAGYA